MQTARIDVVLASPLRQLVARHTLEVCRVHEELILGHAQRQDVRHLLVGHRVPVAAIVDKAVNAAHPVQHPRRVVGVTRLQQPFAPVARSHARPIEADADEAPASWQGFVQPALRLA